MEAEERQEGGQRREIPRHVRFIVDAVTDEARPIAASLGVEIDRIEYRDASKRALLQVFIDRQPGGVTLDDCAALSRQLSATLDARDVVPKAYVLEVSSPGLDRPIHGEAEFRRFTGRPASLTFRRAIEGGSKLKGVLRGVEDGAVLVEVPGGKQVRVPLDLVAKAKLEVD